MNDDELQKRLLAKENNIAIGHYRQSSITQSEHNNINYDNEAYTSTATATSAAAVTIVLDKEYQALANTNLNVMDAKVTLALHPG